MSEHIWFNSQLDSSVTLDPVPVMALELDEV